MMNHKMVNSSEAMETKEIFNCFLSDIIKDLEKEWYNNKNINNSQKLSLHYIFILLRHLYDMLRQLSLSDNSLKSIYKIKKESKELISKSIQGIINNQHNKYECLNNIKKPNTSYQSLKKINNTKANIIGVKFKEKSFYGNTNNIIGYKNKKINPMDKKKYEIFKNRNKKIKNKKVQNVVKVNTVILSPSSKNEKNNNNHENKIDSNRNSIINNNTNYNIIITPKQQIDNKSFIFKTNLYNSSKKNMFFLKKPNETSELIYLCSPSSNSNILKKQSRKYSNKTLNNKIKNEQSYTSRTNAIPKNETYYNSLFYDSSLYNDFNDENPIRKVKNIILKQKLSHTQNINKNNILSLSQKNYENKNSQSLKTEEIEFLNTTINKFSNFKDNISNFTINNYKYKNRNYHSKKKDENNEDYLIKNKTDVFDFSANQNMKERNYKEILNDCMKNMKLKLISKDKKKFNNNL